MGIGGARTSLKRMEGTRKEGARRETQARKQGAGWPQGVGETETETERARGKDCKRVGERRTEVAEVELMHAPGHAPKPLTGSQPTSLYDKYKRRAQRLLLIAWQKLRNPHFVLRTPDSLSLSLSLLPASLHQPLVSLLLFLFRVSPLFLLFSSRLSPRSGKK